MIVRPILCKPFIGRLEELQYLRERRLEAAVSHGGLVLIAGDAGLGKSRLISEFFSSLTYSRWRMATGACLEFASRPYGPLLDVIARLDDRPFALGAVPSKTEQFDAIVERIAAICERSAIAIVIEDIHWADAATLDLLAYLGPSLATMRALVVATYRTGDLPLDHPSVVAIEKIVRGARAGRIDLAPLRGAELRTFIDEALADISLPQNLKRSIAIASDGNPFFTEELLKSAVEAFDPVGRASDRPTLPHDVRATLLGRLRPFDDEERRVVTQAAVIGRTFALELLAETLATETALLLPALRRARDLQLIEESSPNTFRFRHGLTREAIYGDFLGAEARPRHRAIAQALEHASPEDRSLEALAYHCWAAGDAVRSARYNEEAGDAAAGVYAHEDALVFFERALESEGLSPSKRGILLEKMAERHIALAATNDAHKAYDRAASAFAEAAAYDREAKARVVSAQIEYTLGRREPMHALEAMLERLDGAEYLALSRVSLGLAWITASKWLPGRAATYLERVDRRALAADPDIRVKYHNVAAWVAMTIGDLDTFRREQKLWLSAAEDTGAARALAGACYNGALCFGFFGEYDDALPLIERAILVSRDARLRQGEENAHQTAAMIHLFRGDLVRARAEAIAIPATTENKLTKSLASAWGLLVAVALDDRDLIATFFDGSEAEQIAKPDFDSAAAFAELLVRRGRRRDAETLLDRAREDGEIIRGSVYTFLAMGKYGTPATRERGRAFLVRAATGPSPSPERYALSLFDARVALEAGRSDDAIAHARTAAEGFRAIRFPLFEAEALEVMGELEEARALYLRCGAAYDAKRLGQTQPSLDGILSGRELEIAKLAVSGQSNVQIARTLSITHKTVEKHLGSAYRKLGVTTRVELRSHVMPAT